MRLAIVRLRRKCVRRARWNRMTGDRSIEDNGLWADGQTLAQVPISTHPRWDREAVEFSSGFSCKYRERILR